MSPSLTSLTILGISALLSTFVHGNGNRLAHLDEPNNPWQFDGKRNSAKLVTPQWIGEEGVEAVIVLAIDDMSGDGQPFRAVLTPIIERLKQIDGRGPVSITCNRPDPLHANMQWFFKQGVSLEAHTLSHPCPHLHGRNFARARDDYHGCVDLLATIPNNKTVGFRFPCMDGQNTPSPRAYAEIMNGVSPAGNFLSMSTSVGVVFTPRDKALPPALFGEEGAKRFAKYLRPGFVNYVENYPYPFVVGNKIWELPFVFPNDYTGSVLFGGNNPTTIADYKAAVDATVLKKGATSLCFHSSVWMSDRMVEIVDHAHRTHGKKVKFLSMREMHGRMLKHMLAGHPLRDDEGRDNGVRIFDLNDDGYMDVLIGNEKAKLCRIWQPAENSWRELPFPLALNANLRFGIINQNGQVAAIAINRKGASTAWRFDGQQWQKESRLTANLNFATFPEGADRGVRLRDLDGDGICELIDGNPASPKVYRFEGTAWSELPFALPPGTSIVTTVGGDAGLRFADLDQDGHEDIIFSNAKGYGTWLFKSMEEGWTRSGLLGTRANSGLGENHPRERTAIPPIVRDDGTNNGAWIKRGHLYWQNEDTGAIMPHHIDSRSFADLMGEQVNQARSAAASLKAIEVHEGFRVELVVAEPLVMDPVDVAWGPDGRLWVAEMADYPLGIDDKGKPGSRIATLSDTDGDGRYDKRTLFADGLETANTVLPWRDGALIVAPPNIWFMRDRDGDGVADEKTVLYEGFGRGNEQHRGNGLAWGLDGWLYVANGDSGGKVRSTKTGKELNLGGFDLRIRPDTGAMEYATGVTQHGRNRDDWGNWVAGNNSNGWQLALEDHYLRRNPKVSQPSARHGLFGVIDLYPSSHVLSHWSGYQRPPAGSPGKLTSGCGYTFYRDRLFDGLVQQSIYFSCPVHNCVTRREISWNGVHMSATRPREESQSEFLRSSDSWFRPTAIRTGPDGGLYVVDLYRLVIEHPEWIDKTLTKEMIADGRLRAGHERGRIYKILPEAIAPAHPVNLAQLSPSQLAVALDSSNGWQRDTAHMMLTWLSKQEQAKSIDRLRAVLRKSTHPAARTQALSALADLNSLSSGDVAAGLGDPHPGVRRNALRVGDLGEQRVLTAALALLDDKDAHVRMQAAYVVGQRPDPEAGRALGKFLIAHADQPYLRSAALTGAKENLDEILVTVLAAERTPATISLFDALMKQLDHAEVGGLVPRLIKRVIQKADPAQGYADWQFTTAARLLEVAAGAPELEGWKENVESLTAEARDVLNNERAAPSTRLAALSLIGQALPRAKQNDSLLRLLTVSTPIELQVAAVKILLRSDNEAAAQTLLKNWAAHGPVVRTSIIDALLARQALSRVLLEFIHDQQRELLASIDVSRRQLLLSSEDEAIRKRAEALFGGSSNADRAAIMKKYAPALVGEGDREKGKALFATLCSACHRLDGIGRSVGPDLAALTNRSKEAYLTAILDPNRAIEQKWMQYIAITKANTTHAGAVAEETSASVTLVGVDGNRATIARTNLKSLTSTGRSLMPEGLEASLVVGQMRDLLAYLRVGGTPRKKFPNNEPKLITQAADYTVSLPSATAEVYGPTIVFEQKYRNLGYWTSEQDRAEWTFELQRDGEFDLWVDWALANQSVNGVIRFGIGEQILVAPVPGTGTWDDYRWGKIGSLALSAGTHRLIAQSEGPFQAGSLIDLRGVRFVPKGRDDIKKGVPWRQVKTVTGAAK